MNLNIREFRPIPDTSWISVRGVDTGEITYSWLLPSGNSGTDFAKATVMGHGGRWLPKSKSWLWTASIAKPQTHLSHSEPHYWKHYLIILEVESVAVNSVRAFPVCDSDGFPLTILIDHAGSVVPWIQFVRGTQVKVVFLDLTLDGFGFPDGAAVMGLQFLNGSFRARMEDAARYRERLARLAKQYR